MVLIRLIAVPLKHMLHEFVPLQFQTHVCHHRRRIFFYEMMPEARRKCASATLTACDKPNNAKQSFPKWTRYREYTFFAMESAEFKVQGIVPEWC